MCNKCNQNHSHHSHNNCGCTEVEEVTYICNECQPESCTECAVKDLGTKCIIYDGDDLPCSGIKKNTILTDLIQQLDTFICKLKDDIANLLVLVNIGTGAKVYAGNNLLGNKKLRTISKTGDLITVTEATEEIVVGLDEQELENTIINLTPNYNAENVGTGADVFKEEVANTFRFRALKGDLQNGTGASVLRDVQENTDDVTFRFKKIKSDSLIITENDEEVILETSALTQIPGLYVNNAYLPSYNQWLVENRIQNSGTAVAGFVFRGKGTTSQPFTDSIVYPLAGGSPTVTPNTAIQNALDGDSTYDIRYSYVGNGSRLAPEKSGQRIIVQDNNFGGYTFLGDFSYSSLNIKLQTSVLATTTGYLVDMDNASYFNENNSFFTIEIEGGCLLEITDSLGFRNSGNTSSAPPAFDTGRIGLFNGEGTLYSSYNGPDILNRYIFTGEGGINDNNLHFNVKCKVRADQQGIYFTKNGMSIDFYNRLQSGILPGIGNPALKAFHMTGGQVRFYEKGAIYLGNNPTGRLYGITFEPTVGVAFTTFELNSAKVSGTAQHCFAKLNNEPVSFLAFNSPSGDGFATTITGTGTVTNGLFENLGEDRWIVQFRNNVFSNTGIDQTKVDLTGGNEYSTINFIGDNVIENLVTSSSRAQALADGRPLYSAYLKTNGTAYPNTSTWTRDIVLPS
jgi:hypothetical protein